MCVLHTNTPLPHPSTPLCFLIFQNADDLLVASAECPSDDEDLEECEPGNGESTLVVLSPFVPRYPKRVGYIGLPVGCRIPSSTATATLPLRMQLCLSHMCFHIAVQSCGPPAAAAARPSAAQPSGRRWLRPSCCTKLLPGFSQGRTVPTWEHSLAPHGAQLRAGRPGGRGAVSVNSGSRNVLTPRQEVEVKGPVFYSRPLASGSIKAAALENCQEPQRVRQGKSKDRVG